MYTIKCHSKYILTRQIDIQLLIFFSFLQILGIPRYKKLAMTSQFVLTQFSDVIINNSVF